MLTNRSTCPINRTVEMLGDRWSLLILRDMAMLEHRTFRSLLTGSREKISPSTLSSRLRELERLGLVAKAPAPIGHQGSYALTDDGVGLVPLLFELARVGSLLDPTTEATAPGVEELYGDPAGIEAFTGEVRRREQTLRDEAAGADA